MIVKMIQDLGNRMEKMQEMLTKGLEEIKKKKNKKKKTEMNNAFSSVQLFNHVQLFGTLCTAAHQSSLSITKSQNLLKLISIESDMKSNHLRLCRPVPFFSCLQSVQASESFPVSQFFTSGGQSIGASASALVFPMNTQN